MIRLASLAVLIAVVSACSGVEVTHTEPLRLRGIVMSHPPTAADSARLSHYGEVVALVRRDTLIILLTGAGPVQLEAVSGVRAAGPWLGESANGGIEVLIGCASTDTARAIMTNLGHIVGRLRDSTIDGFIPANRLGELDHYPAITYLSVEINPPHAAAARP